MQRVQKGPVILTIFLKIQFVHVILDREWDPKTNILACFSLFSAFVLQIWYFSAKKVPTKKTLQRANFFLKISKNVGIKKSDFVLFSYLKEYFF